MQGHIREVFEGIYRERKRECWVYLWHLMAGNSPIKAQSVASWSAILVFMSCLPTEPEEKIRRNDSGKLRLNTCDSLGRNPMNISFRDFISDVCVCMSVCVCVSVCVLYPW